MLIYLLIAIIAIMLGGIILLSSMFKIWRQRRISEWSDTQSYTVLRIDVPKNNDKAPLSAEQMFAALHGVYSESAQVQYQISFEIVAKDKYIQFYVHTPVHLKDFVEGQIYAQYPTVEIKEVRDYVLESNNMTSMAGAELLMTKPDVYPIKLFSDFEVDPISGITSVMAKLGTGEQVWLQIIVRPVGDEWQDKGNQLINAIKSGKRLGAGGFLQSFASGASRFGKMFISQAINPGGEVVEGEKQVNLPGTVEEALKSIEFKIMKLGFETKIRIMSLSSDPTSAKVKTQNIGAAFKQYNTTNLNGFVPSEIKVNDANFINEFTSRKFDQPGNILNIGELASIYHFPNENVETPSIVWSGSKKGEPPANLPLVENTPKDDLTIIGETTFRNIHHLFGIKRDDRRRHIYLIGKSGVGKSVLLENMAIHDLLANKGVIVVDPHGEFAEKVLACIPNERINDVIVFDPADRANPIAFNLLEHVDDDFKGMVASGFVGIFKKIFGNSWGPRLEHILRNTVLALLDYPNSTMLDIPRMLTETRFRDKVVEAVLDPVIKEFWTMEFAQYDNKFRTEAVSPILNKVGQFLATATIRNIVGQPKSTINIREIMDNEKIMVVNLSRGKIGEDNSALLGAMMITKIQLAAMSRADVTVDNRKDCYLYVDEFQNFATESFSVILSEARKYHLNLTIANQYITQMAEEVRDAVFGNAGTIISFRVGGADADFLVKEFEPVFEGNDMVNLDKYNVYIKLLIDGVSSPAFSARTLPPVESISGNVEKIIDISRKKYTRPRVEVEAQIAERSLNEQKELKDEALAFKSGGLEAILLKKKGEESRPQRTEERKEVRIEEHRDGKFERPEDNKAERIANSQVSESGSGLTTESKVSPINIENRTESNHEAESVATTGVDEQQGGENDQPVGELEKEKKPRFLKHKNILGDMLFKEQTARGGIKWYVGEKINIPELEENGVVITPEATHMMDLAKRVYTTDHKSSSKHDGEKQSKPNRKKDESKKHITQDQTHEMGQSEKVQPRVEESMREIQKEVDKPSLNDASGEVAKDESDSTKPIETSLEAGDAHPIKEMNKIEDQSNDFVVIYDGSKDGGNEGDDRPDSQSYQETVKPVNQLVEGEAVKID